MTERLKVYVDLDGVLADFDRHYSKVVGKSREDWPCTDGNDDLFWFPIIRTKRFWLDIPLMKDAMELWEFVSKHHYVTILSSPGTHDTERATIQKRLWVANHLGENVNMVLKQAKQKHHYACPNSVLIDDWEKNIKNWQAAGGLTIHHKSAKETIEALKLLGL